MAARRSTQRKSGGKRQRTRTALIAAALDVVSEKGFSGASLDEIAAKAGMSKGAIYSNFSGKAELLGAAMNAKGLSVARLHPEGRSLRKQLQDTTKDLVTLLHRAQGDAKLIAEFQLYALTDPELKRAVAAGYTSAFAMAAQHISRHADLRRAIRPKHLAVAVQSIALGLLFQSFITPDEVSDEVITLTMKALADGVTINLPRTGGRRVSPQSTNR